MDTIYSIQKLFRSTFSIGILFLILSISIFGNSIYNEFAVVDDLSGYIENETIRSIPNSIKSFSIQEIVYSINYHFFGMNPTPLRIFALINHAIVGYLLFLIMTTIFNKKAAFIASVLFLVHPVTTETINWISAQFYIVMAIIVLLCLLALIAYRNTSEKKYIYIICALFTFDIIFIRHAWVLILPFVITTFDYFFLKKKTQQRFYNYFLGISIPIIILFIILNFSGQFSQRILGRNESGKTLQNEQSLTPVIQGYPYTIYSLVRLYTFPKDVTIYYDGSKITTITHILMYSSFLVYLGIIFYSWKKNKKFAGLLLLLLLFILPVFSPKKITWFITERYLYLGTGFFTTMLALLFIKIEQWSKIKHLAFILAGIVFLLYSIKTVHRNSEWKNPEILAFSTIKTSPYSVRPYNDLAGYYVMQKKYQEAKEYYVKALQVSSSLTAIRNLGHIYMETGFDTSIQTIEYPADQVYNEAQRMIQSQEYFAAAYYLNEALSKDADNPDIYNRIAELFVMYEKKNVAKQYIQELIQKNKANADSYYILAFITYSEENYPEAQTFIDQTLQIDPNHAAALQLQAQLPVN
ncbi:MAG TPA: hypothetical protein PLS49_01365 [Candidatus Woesebacteria bacterium]|mgnify:CR=1 FL=1|nr:hypothetical protein [Candidatus Woesebacteria bacterium]